VVLLPFFVFCCFVLNFVFFCFFIPLKKGPPKKPDTAKTQKSKNAEKTDKKNQLAQLCSQIVFLIFWGGLVHFLAENTIKIVVSASFRTSKNTQKVAKMLSQNLVQGCVKTWSKYVAQQNWTKF